MYEINTYYGGFYQTPYTVALTLDRNDDVLLAGGVRFNDIVIDGQNGGGGSSGGWVSSFVVKVKGASGSLGWIDIFGADGTNPSSHVFLAKP